MFNIVWKTEKKVREKELDVMKEKTNDLLKRVASSQNDLFILLEQAMKKEIRGK